MAGYVIRVNEEATNDNPNFAGAKRVLYIGANLTCVGLPSFKPYKSISGAAKGWKAWERHFEHPVWKHGWKYTIDSIIPYEEYMKQEVEEQMNEDMEIIASILD